MARPVQDAGDQILDLDALGARQRLQVDRRFGVDIDQIGRQAAADRNLVHIDIGRVQEPARFRHGDDGQRILGPLGGDRRALQRIERDIDLGATGADLFADEQHRRLIPLALADHDDAVDRERIQRLAHGVDRGLVRGFLVAASHQPGCRQRRRLRHANRLQRQVAFQHVPFCHVRHFSFAVDQESSMRIRQGSSSTVPSPPIRTSARFSAASPVSWVVRTTGTGSFGARPR